MKYFNSLKILFSQVDEKSKVMKLCKSKVKPHFFMRDTVIIFWFLDFSSPSGPDEIFHSVIHESSVLSLKSLYLFCEVLFNVNITVS